MLKNSQLGGFVPDPVAYQQARKNMMQRLHLFPSMLALSFTMLLSKTAIGDSNFRAVPYVWKNVIVGGGGFIPGIVFSPVEKNLVYLRSDMGGFYRWDDSHKSWIPLNDSMSESSYHGGESIAPDPVNPDIVYAAAGMYQSDPAAMLRSHDRGKTWEIFPVPFKMGGNEDGRGLGERLAVDPNNTHVLYFGSRHDGLMRSSDSAKSWKRVEGFPLKGGGAAGLSFVVFDPADISTSGVSKTIFVASADPGDQYLFCTKDAGQTWNAIKGGPGVNMLPIQGKLDPTGILYITYGNGVGPNGVTDGCVYALNIKTSQWANITPEKNVGSTGGYAGLSLDHQHPGTLAVSTFNHWSPTDTVWRTTDGGKNWLDIADKSQRDVTATPFLYWGKPTSRLGWWLAALAIDPFDSNHVVYTTGATVYASNDFSNTNKGEATHWKPWVTGIDQTAVITLVSPADGPHLFSGFGDIGGFAHDDLDHSPPQGMYTNPLFTNTDSIDYAALRPNVIVRSGRGDEASYAYSEDSGHTWQPLTPPSSTTQRRRRVNQQFATITVSADGRKIIVQGRGYPMISADRGKAWFAPPGLTTEVHIVVDRINPDVFYAMDFAHSQLLISRDGGTSFRPQACKGLPNEISESAGDERWSLKATTTKQGDLWLIGGAGLRHSSDAGNNFTNTGGNLQVEMLAFGKAPPGHDYPALFAIGTMDSIKAIWRSDDTGKTWLRVNDDAHQYGTRFRCIEGDPRLFGRVYFGTDGRGILYGDPAAPN